MCVFGDCHLVSNFELDLLRIFLHVFMKQCPFLQRIQKGCWYMVNFTLKKLVWFQFLIVQVC